MRHLIRALVVLAVLGAPAAPLTTRAAAAPAGQVTWAVHFTLAPRWLDPAESEGSIAPFLTLYAVHDALLKPMPSGPTSPSLAESWSASPDGLALFAPIWENGFIRAVGPRVEEPALTLIPSFPYSAPYEDVRLKATP